MGFTYKEQGIMFKYCSTPLRTLTVSFSLGRQVLALSTCFLSQAVFTTSVPCQGFLIFVD